jgi:O-6-methylguanine DNA methyltransferase
MKTTSTSDKSSRFHPLKINTSWGPICLTLQEDGEVTRCELPVLDAAPDVPFQIEGDLSLEALFATHPVTDSPEGTPFQLAVWNAIRQIPRGQTRTYREIAATIGRPRAVRAVGTACGANPIPLWVPCHRVVAKTGIGGFTGGLAWKRLLLTLEQSA